MQYAEWHYAMFPDERQQLGPHTTVIARVVVGDYTVLGIFPGPELAEHFLDILALAPHESLFDFPAVTR